MAHRSRRVLRMVLSVSALLLATSGAALSFVDTRPSNVRAAEWARGMGTSLPRTLDALSAYPVAFRKAAFRELTPAERSQLWHEHLEVFRNTHALTKEQLGLLSRLNSVLTPEIYAGVETSVALGSYSKSA